MIDQNHLCCLKSKKKEKLSQRIRRSLKGTKKISKRHPLAKFYFHSDAALIYERNRHRNYRYRHIIHPFSCLRLFWEILMFFIFMIITILDPLIEMFRFSSPPIITILTLVDIFFVADIIMSFYTGYFDKVNTIVVLEPRAVHLNYIKRDLFCDVAAGLPAHLIISVFRIKTEFVLVISLLKIFRLKKLYRYFKTLQEFFGFSYAKSRTLAFVFWTILIVHWIACLNYAIPYMMHRIRGDWDKDSWLLQSSLIGRSHILIYYRCFFRAVCHLVGVDYGLIWPIIKEDLLLGTFMLFFGRIFFAYLFVASLQIMLTGAWSEIKSQDEMNQLQAFMCLKQYPRQLQKRIYSYFRYRYRAKYFKESIVLEKLSADLRKEVLFTTSKRLLERVYIFRDISETMLQLLTYQLKYEVCLPNDIIIKAGTYGDTMYLLQRGTVAVYTANGKEVCHLQNGGYFGEAALVIPDEPRMSTIISIEICEIYSLDRHAFEACFATRKDLYDRLIKDAKRKLMENTIKSY